jgi:hypothetical protein
MPQPFSGSSSPPLFDGPLGPNIFKNKEVENVLHNAYYYCAEFKKCLKVKG